MDKQRYYELSTNMELKLTPEEVAAGWHFCPDWDDMLIHKDGPEAGGCTCSRGKS